MPDFAEEQKRILVHYSYRIANAIPHYCPFCGMSDIDVRYSVRLKAEGEMVDYFDCVAVVKCNSCGLEFEINHPSLENLAMWSCSNGH